jgi:CDP-4-dehydro-6-deoxyglucose reductase
MARVECDGRPVPVETGETLLDALLRAGIPLPHSCRAGVCQSCLVKATSGAPPTGSQTGLRSSLAQQGFLLACMAHPVDDLTLSTDAAAGLTVAAAVTAVDAIAGDVVRVLVTPDVEFPYRAGQYVTLLREDGLARSYSVANLPGSGALELHVRVLPGGQMSQWLASRPVGARVSLRGPNGECFYEPAPEAPLVLAGTGTGLAPLWGVLNDALRAGHAGPIHVMHGARGPAGLYLVDELQALAAAHANVVYSACVLDDARDGMTQGALDEVLFARFPSLSGHRVFLCGDPALVQKMKRKAFLAGARLSDIRADAFITAPPPASAN